MIIDRIENAPRYYALGSGITEALEYIKNNDLGVCETGKHEICKDKVQMIVNEYDQKNNDRVKLEAHRKHIDVQYWVSGSELMGYAPLQAQALIDPFNEDDDYGLYTAEATFTKLEPGMFAIYFPTDLHTAVKDEQCNSLVRKIVFKVVVE